MPFSNRIKLEAKRRSAFRCCICYRFFVEVHHIVPQAEGGADTLDNAAALCSECHDLFGGNPEKRAQLREMRDLWWNTMEERARNLTRDDDMSDCTIVSIDKNPHGKLSARPTALYHRIFESDTFEDAVEKIWQLVRHAQILRPGAPRVLYLDIDGHRNSEGGFDEDMYELQKDFVLGAIGRYIKAAHMPLFSVRMPGPQLNDLPDDFYVVPRNVVLEDAITDMDDTIEAIYIGDAARWLRPEKRR